MRIIVLAAFITLFASCSTSGPITANPDRSTTTDGTAGSAKSTEGSANEGMNTSKNRALIDSLRAGKDSVRTGRDSLPVQKR